MTTQHVHVDGLDDSREFLGGSVAINNSAPKPNNHDNYCLHTHLFLNLFFILDNYRIGKQPFFTVPQFKLPTGEINN